VVKDLPLVLFGRVISFCSFPLHDSSLDLPRARFFPTFSDAIVAVLSFRGAEFRARPPLLLS